MFCSHYSPELKSNLEVIFFVLTWCIRKSLSNFKIHWRTWLKTGELSSINYPAKKLNCDEGCNATFLIVEFGRNACGALQAVKKPRKWVRYLSWVISINVGLCCVNHIQREFHLYLPSYTFVGEVSLCPFGCGKFVTDVLCNFKLVLIKLW